MALLSKWGKDSDSNRKLIRSGRARQLYAIIIFLLCVSVSQASAVSFQGAAVYSVGSGPYSVTAADLNGDGKPDLAVANVNSNNVSILLGNGNGTFQAAVNYGAGSGPFSVTAADLNGDGKLDLAVANYSSNNVSILLGNGNGTFQAAVNYDVGTSPYSVTAADLNGDGKPDLAVANASSNNVSILLGNGNGTFQAAVNYGAGSGSFSVTAADLNGDGKPDLAVANYSSNNVSILLGNGNGTFQAAVNYGVGTSPYSVTIADLNGDGKPDLAVANYSSNNVSILFGNGNGTFQAAVNYGAGSGPFSVTAADLNGDGKPDLAVANASSNNVSILLGNGNGTFQAAVNYGAGSGPISVTIADLNGDGKPDLAVANYNSNNVSVLINTMLRINSSAGAHGTIICSPLMVDPKGSSDCSITPDSGYFISDVAVNGTSVGAVGAYNISNVTIDTTVAATFVPDAPVASFTASPNPAACSQTISFDGTASNHPNPARSIVSYAWHYGDASQTGTGATSTHAYGAFGTYTASLTVTDDNVPPKTATSTVSVTVNQGNIAPVASSGGPYAAFVGATGNTLDGTGSTEPNAACGDSVVSYSWNIGGGALILTGSQPGLSPAQVAALGAGSFPVVLTVQDTFGATGTSSTTLTIQNDATPPTTLASSAGYSFGNWTSSGTISVTLSADDGTGSGVALGYPKYCVDAANTCTPNTNGTAVNATCALGNVCTQYVRYQSQDNAGNTELIKSAVVKQDLQAPTLTASAAYVDSTHVDVTFNDSVTGGATAGNYAGSNGLTISGASSQGGNVYRLTTSHQTVGTTYTITASNITDAAGNVLDPAQKTATFTRLTSNNTVPTMPTINSPISFSETGTTTPTLVVNASTDADNDPITYIYEVYTDSGLTSLATTTTCASTSWIVDVPLTDNTTYFWRALASDGDKNSSWMATGNFFINTTNDVPAGLALNAPTNNTQVTTVTPVLSVTNAADADIYDIVTYDFDVATDNGFTNIVSSVTNIVQGAGGVTSFVTETLNDNTLYYWRAKAVDSHGAESNVVSASFFVNTSNNAPTAPAQNAPAQGSEVATFIPTLTVSNAADLDHDSLHYVFEIDTVNTFNSANKQTSGLLVEGAGTTSWTPAALSENTTYYWRVKANDGQANGPWLATTNFFVNTVNEAPSTPTLNNPSNNGQANTLTPTLQVNASTDPDYDSLAYDYEVYSDSNLTTLVTSTTGAGTGWIVGTTLGDNTTYYWRARARDFHDLTSGWMMPGYFFVNNNGYNDPPVITVTEPGASEPIIYGNSCTIAWTAFDPDSIATITLGYDETGSGCTGIQIAAGITEKDGADTYTWDITALSPGIYHVYTSITDGNITVCVYAPGPLIRSNTTGDMNNDGTVDIADALRALRIAAGLITPSASELGHGDVAPMVNGVPQPDGRIDIGDVVVLLRKSVGLVNW